jgi:hypothetical protein
MNREPWRVASLSDPLAVPAPAPPSRIGIELVGGPAAGMLLEWSGPLPAVIRVPVLSPVGWADPRLDYGYPVAAARSLAYEVRDTWNPTTRRRQYVHIG